MATPIQFNSEVVDFIAQHNLGNTCFLILLNMMKIYSKLVSIEIELDYWQDGGDDEGHLVFNIVLESDQETALKDYNDYVTWEVTNIVPDDCVLCAMTIERR